ncbi:hypothetical protein ACFV28_08315, partial [Streptomyces sp. NPDC059720]
VWGRGAAGRRVASGGLRTATPWGAAGGPRGGGAPPPPVEADASGTRLPAHMQYLVDRISPAIDHGEEGDARIDATVDANVRLVRSQLAAEPELAAEAAAGRLAIVGARYELSSQAVHRLTRPDPT